MQQNAGGGVLPQGECMKKLCVVASIGVGLFAAAGCNRQDTDHARSESRDAEEKAQRQLERTRDKVREDLKRADAQTREDLDKARDQLHHALNQSESDAEKTRDKLRDRVRERDNPDSDSHQ
jgi:outer membrane murein-binding lipoprotein Lpp